MKQTMYTCRGVTLATDGDAYIVTFPHEREAEAFANPIKAWATYWDAVDCAVRRRIGDMLEAEGKNRYTGE